jgi:hypothetical protein
MIENRRVRFGNLERVDKFQLAVACEIWLDDVLRAPWSTREAMRIGAHLVNYIQSANASILFVREIETALQLNREEINRAMNLLRLFRAISDFKIERDEIRASLNLSTLQTIRLLEVVERCRSAIDGGQSDALAG